jgi:DNA topoisomerase I
MATSTRKKATSKTRSGSKPAARKSSAKPEGLGRNLVVVESPAKAKTINNYLGKDYIVKASMGHVRDLPKSDLGVDTDNDFAPTYQPLDGRKSVLVDLRKYAKAAGEIFLATDLDREGEAIAWHLAESLSVPAERFHRVVFNEITPSAIRDAFEHPRDVDMHKVNAQQARRILDRIVGYQVSPLLWKKVARGLSAGRVQSVAVRLIVDREREIDLFTPEEYWRIGGVFTADLSQAGPLAEQWEKFLAQRDDRDRPPSQDAQQQFLAERNAFRGELARWKGRKFRPDSAEDALEVLRALNMTVEEVRRGDDPSGKGPAAHPTTIVARLTPACPELRISEIARRERKSNPPAPFTTATLQQNAAVQLRFGAARTMRTAQQLYEGVTVPNEGSVGLITYMRTDSTHLSKDALDQARSHIREQFGDAYLPDKPRHYTSGKRAQEAHEAVRPTDVSRTPASLRGCLEDPQMRLYELIWKRFVACQMAPAVWELTEATISAETDSGTAEFKALGRRLKFDGHLKVAGLPRGGDQLLPELEPDHPVAPVHVSSAQHFTQPPPRYTEASLVKALEADGIGRPSTYAAIIKTIQDRGYVELTDRTFRPTDVGLVVTDKLVKHLPGIFDVRFTAHMEDQLDRVEEGQADWVAVLREFYAPFSDNLKLAFEEMVHAKAESTPSDYTCEKCGQPMVYKFSRNGRYLACSGYPDCKSTHPVDKDGRKIEKIIVDIACPKCGQAMVLRRGRFGPFLSCPTYPECDGVLNLDRKGFVKLPSPPPLQVDLECPKCKSPLNLRRGKRGPWLSCSKYPKCRGRMGWKTLEPDLGKQLELQLLNHEKEHPQPVLRTMGGEPIGEEHTPTPLSPTPTSESIDDSSDPKDESP